MPDPVKEPAFLYVSILHNILLFLYSYSQNKPV